MNGYKVDKQKSIEPLMKVIRVAVLFMFLVAACAPAATEEPPAEQPVAQEPPSGDLPTTSCETLLPAEACDPEWESRIQYTPLTSLASSECTERFVDAAIGRCLVFAYASNGQDFTITVDGADAAVVDDFISTTAVYFEVQRAATEIAPDPELPSLATILIDAAADVTGVSHADLSVQRDKLTEEREANGEYTTVAEVLYLATGDESIPGQVLELAIQRASEIYAERGYDSSQIPEELQALMDEPGASVLVDPAALPQAASDYRNLLMTNPAGLVVTLDWASVPKEPSEEAWVIWYAIDPILSVQRVISNPQASVGGYAYVYYRAKCNVYSAYTKITATAGSMTNYFWRQSPYLYVGSRTANIQVNASPNAISHSSFPNKVSYDTYVRGGQQGGKYFIYGGWVQGSGCQ